MFSEHCLFFNKHKYLDSSAAFSAVLIGNLPGRACDIFIRADEFMNTSGMRGLDDSSFM